MNRQSVPKFFFQKFLFQVFWLCFVSLVPVSASYWLHYHHLPHWSTFVFVAVMAVPAVAAPNHYQTRKR